MDVKNFKRNVLGELSTATNNENVQSSLKGLILPPQLCNSSVKENDTKPSFSGGPPKSVSHLTNLELLTKVASGMIYDTKQDVILEYGDENLNLNDTQSREHCKPRKEKSLSILCDKFLKRYPLTLKPGNYMEISLDQATQFIGTDRRRIYDILIVLECLQMASKVCKNHYQWHGTQHLEGTLSQLKWLALRLGFFQNVNVADYNVLLNEDCTKECETSDLNILDPEQMNVQTQKVLSNAANFSQSNSLSPTGTTGEMQDHKLEEESDLDHKDNSLGIMCQKFLMLFLVKSKVVTLDVAAKILLGASGVVKDCHRVKTKIRRLYDIANVLSSLELIEKVNVEIGSATPSGSFIRSNKKPAFRYIGPEVQPKPLPDNALVTLHTTRHSLLGHPLHAACEKKCSRKRKTRPPCPLQPKLQNVNNGSSGQVKSAGTSFIHERSASFAFSSGSPREKFPRSHSENCIGESPKCHGSLRSDILQVAELELQRISNEEQQEKEKEVSSTARFISSTSKSASIASKANWRHHHSDNCISIGSQGSHTNYSDYLKNSNDISWKNSILKPTNVRINASTGTNSLIKNSNVMTVLTSQKGSNLRKDVPVCIINQSNSVAKTAEGKLIPFSKKSAVPILIHSAQKGSRARSISINPVPISISNCIMGPAYIIRQHPSGSVTNINPVSISLRKGGHVVSSKDLFCVENSSNPEKVPMKTY